MDGELYSFTDAFDALLTIAADLIRFLGEQIPLCMPTDSK